MTLERSFSKRIRMKWGPCLFSSCNKHKLCSPQNATSRMLLYNNPSKTLILRGHHGRHHVTPFQAQIWSIASCENSRVWGTLDTSDLVPLWLWAGWSVNSVHDHVSYVLFLVALRHGKKGDGWIVLGMRISRFKMHDPASLAQWL